MLRVLSFCAAGVLVCGAAVRGGRIQDPAPRPEPVEALLQRLAGTERSVLGEAVRDAAGVRDPRVVERLVDLLLRDARGDVRALAAASLGRSADPRAADALLRAVREEPATFVRNAALAGLGGTGDPRAFDVLVAALDDPNGWPGAHDGLAALGDARAVPLLAGRLAEHGVQARDFAAAATALTVLDRAVAGEVLLALLDRGGDPPAPQLVARLRACTDCDAVRARAAELAGDEDPARRRAGIAVLGGVGDLRSVSFLLGRLGVDRELRIEVIAALGELGHEFAVDPIARFVSDGSPAVREAAVDALVRIGHPTAVAPLCEVLARSAEPRDLVRALEGLGRLGDPAALRAIAPRLVDERRSDRPIESSAIWPWPHNVAVCDAAWWAARAILDGSPPCAAEELCVFDADGPERPAAERLALRRRIEER